MKVALHALERISSKFGMMAEDILQQIPDA
jgi:hypothetical protein